MSSTGSPKRIWSSSRRYQLQRLASRRVPSMRSMASIWGSWRRCRRRSKSNRISITSSWEEPCRPTAENLITIRPSCSITHRWLGACSLMVANLSNRVRQSSVLHPRLTLLPLKDQPLFHCHLSLRTYARRASQYPFHRHLSWRRRMVLRQRLTKSVTGYSYRHWTTARVLILSVHRKWSSQQWEPPDNHPQGVVASSEWERRLVSSN